MMGGDLDIISGVQDGDFYFYEDTSSVGSPSFNAAVVNDFGLTDIGNHSKPAFADMDNDGDLDMLVGAHSGSFYYFQDTSTVGSPAFDAVVTNPFGLTSVGNRSTVALVDIDNDGDLDLVSGDSYGDFYFYQDTSTTGSPAFDANVMNPFGLVSLGDDNTLSSFVDLDNDGDMDMIAGAESGAFLYYENTGTTAAPAFAASTINPFDLFSTEGYSTPAFADMDNDGDMDLLSGDYYGNFFYYENNSVPAAPANTTAGGNLTICSGSSTSLSATGVGTLGWYDAATAGNYLGGGSPFTTPVLTGNATYFVQDSTAGFASARTAISVTVTPLPNVATSTVGGTITATLAAATSYQWVTCPSYANATGTSTARSYTTAANGSYAVIITNNGCVDTSSCVNIAVGIDEALLSDKVSVYPNPSNDIVTLDLAVEARVEITDALGRIIFSRQLSPGKELVDFSLEEKGIYFVRVSSEDKQTVKRLVINE